MLTLKVGHHYLTRGGTVFTVLDHQIDHIGTTEEFWCSDQHARSAKGRWLRDEPTERCVVAEINISPIAGDTTINTPPVVTSQQHTDLCNVLHAIINGIPDDDLRGAARDILNNHIHEYRRNPTVRA